MIHNYKHQKHQIGELRYQTLTLVTLINHIRTILLKQKQNKTVNSKSNSLRA